MKLSSKISQIPPNPFSQIGKRIKDLERAGAEIIRLDIGSPDMPPANHIIEMLATSARNPHHHGYQSHNATADLRFAWAHHYAQYHNVTLDPETQILPLIGSKEGIFHLAQILLNPGDTVIIPTPAYQTYRISTLAAGANIYLLPLTEDDGYTPNLDKLPQSILDKAKMLWVNYPNNPTGATITPDQLSKLWHTCQKHNILLCNDAAYSLIHDGHQPAPSLMSLPHATSKAIEFNTLSKSYNMAGWRQGVVVGNPLILDALLKYKTHVDSGHFRPNIDAAVAALTGPQEWLHERNDVYKNRRIYLRQGLTQLGFDVFDTQATLYLWASTPHHLPSSFAAQYILDHARISTTPGLIFDDGGEFHLRFAITQPIRKLEQALDRLAKLDFNKMQEEYIHAQ